MFNIIIKTVTMNKTVDRKKMKNYKKLFIGGVIEKRFGYKKNKKII